MDEVNLCPTTVPIAPGLDHTTEPRSFDLYQDYHFPFEI